MAYEGAPWRVSTTCHVYKQVGICLPNFPTPHIEFSKYKRTIPKEPWSQEVVAKAQLKILFESSSLMPPGSMPLRWTSALSQGVVDTPTGFSLFMPVLQK